MASLAANALGLSSNAADSAELTRRKDLARQRLQHSGIPVPAFRVVNLSKALQPQVVNVTYPMVLKPVSMSGSKGVIRANNEHECLNALARIRHIVAHLPHVIERESVLMESYIVGSEVAFEGLLHKGKLKQLTIFDKPDSMEGPFFEETYYITPSCLSKTNQQKVFNRVAEACNAYGLKEGPIHAELRLAEDDVYIIEIASRTIGGDCADMLKFGLNIGIEELVLLQAVGRPVTVPDLKGSVGVLMIPIPSQGLLRRVEGMAQAEKIEYIKTIGISVREGYELVPLPEGSSYLGFIFAKAPTAERVENALRAAHACLNIVVAPSIKLKQR